MHRTWKDCPVCQLAKKATKGNPELPQVALRIRDGEREYRTVCLPLGKYQVGFSPISDLVFTPSVLPIESMEEGEISVSNDQVRLVMHGDKAKATVDGTEYKELILYDRDRVQVFRSDVEVMFLRRELL